MFETPDYLVNEPWTGMIRMISDRTYLSLNPSHCSLVSLETITGLSTRIVIKTNRSKSSINRLPPLPEELTYEYSRLDPSTYLGTITIGVIKVPTTTMEILAEVTKQTDIAFNLDDFEAIEITDYGVVELDSKPTSLRWVGSLTVNLVNQTSRVLSEVITQNHLGNVILMANSGDSRKTDMVYFANTDFTLHRTALEAMFDSPNGLNVDRLAVILKDVTGDSWQCTVTPSEFNICSEVREGIPYVRMLYAGAPLLRYTTRTDKRRVIVLATDETLCTGFKGLVLLHYD